MNKEQYVSFEVAKLLKEKGFDWECDSWTAEYITGVELHTGMERRNYNDDSVSLYDGLFSAPTQQLACRWLREEKKIHLELEFCVDDEFSFSIFQIDGKRTFLYQENRYWKKAEDAVDAALLYVIQNLI